MATKSGHAHVSGSKDFVELVASLRFPNAFNPYVDCCPEHDLEEGPSVRRRNLELVVAAAITRGIDSIWIARDLGYRGGRRTGLPLTDEAHLTAHSDLYGWLPLRRATRGPEVAEATARVVWRMIEEIRRPIFLWNVFPLHPHAPSSPLSNRCHSRVEREGAEHLILSLVRALRPRLVVAIGRDAERCLSSLNVPALAVRHPSYGGQRDFETVLRAAYGTAGRRS